MDFFVQNSDNLFLKLSAHNSKTTLKMSGPSGRSVEGVGLLPLPF